MRISDWSSDVCSSVLERARVGRRDAAGGAEAHVVEGTGEGLEHGQAAGLHRREELELRVAALLRLHHLAARGHARQQRQAEVAAGLPHRMRVAWADGK